MSKSARRRATAAALGLALAAGRATTQSTGVPPTYKPPLHGRHWMAITGKPLAATAGAMMFQKGGNAVDAACAMLAATATVWDTLGWGGETQALIYDPRAKKVIGVNALGVAPSGATPEFFRAKDMRYPPEFGPLAAVTPGTPGGLLVMLAEYGRLSLKEVLAPAMQLAEGFPIERQLAESIERRKKNILEWPDSKAVFLTHPGAEREGPEPGEVFRQPDLLATLRKLVAAEEQALRARKGRKQAILAAYERFYKGDIAQELVRATQAQGGLITLDDLARWQVKLEEPVKTDYRGIEVYKLNTWTQGPALLQTLNILEQADLKSMGYNSARYIHTLYQAMNLAFADRDFYYGDPDVPPAEPLQGLLSKDYARERFKLLRADRNDAQAKPGDPYPFQGGTHPFRALLDAWPPKSKDNEKGGERGKESEGNRLGPPWAGTMTFEEAFTAGTTSVVAADAEGWVVSMTPSGGWVPAFVAGRTGVGLSQRMQSFVLDEAENPYNVLVPGKRPRVTLTPSLALKDGAPYLAFAVQGGDSQDQNLLQFFLNVAEFGMSVQEAVEAANINSYQMRSSFGAHESRPGRVLLPENMPPWVRRELRSMGYDMEFQARTSGPINAILFDRAHGTLWGGSSHHGEDYGISW